MITDTPRPRRLRFTAWPKIALGIAAFLVLVSIPAKAAEPEEDYLPIFNLIQQGDALDKQGRPDQALTKYDQAIKHIREFQIRYPAFNVKMLAYRSNDVAQKIASISSKGNEAEGGQQPSSGSSSNAAAPGGQRTTGGGAVSGVSLKLLQPGAEPRKALRLHPKQGDKQTMTI